MNKRHNQNTQPANQITDPTQRRKEFLRRKNVVPLSRNERLRQRFLPAVAALGIVAVGAFNVAGNVIDNQTIDETTYSVDVTTHPSIAEGAQLALREAMESSVDPNMSTAAARVDVGEAAADIADTIFASTGESARQQSGHIVEYHFEQDGDTATVEFIK